MISENEKTKKTGSSGTYKINLVSMLSLKRIALISTTTDKKPFNTNRRNRSFLSTPAIKTLKIFALGLLLFTSCRKDEFIPVSNSNNGTLKAGGVSYYVDAAGSDVTGNGSINAPWKSLYKASLSVTNAGDIIQLMPGTYINNTANSFANGVSIIGADTATTKIICNYAGNNFSFTSATLTDGNQVIQGINFDGNNTGHCAVYIRRRHNVDVTLCEFQDFVRSALRLDYDVIGTPTVTGCDITYNTFRNNSSNTNTSSGCGGFSLYGYKDFTIAYNNVLESGQTAGWGFQTNYTSNMDFHHNTVNVLNHNDNISWSWCMESNNGSGGDKIHDNVLNGPCDFAGYNHLKGSYAYSLEIYNNTFGSPTLLKVDRQGIYLEANGEISDVLIRDNVFKNLSNALQFQTVPATVMKRITIRHNIFTNIGRNTADSYGTAISRVGAAVFSMRDIYVYNNVFDAATVVGGWQQPAIYLPSKGTVSNFRIINNVFRGFEGGNISTYQLSAPYGTIDLLYIQNNDTYQCGYSNLPHYTGCVPTNVNASGSLTVNPLFVSSSDYHLQSGSTLINTGINVGLSFNGTAPDLGAFETTGGGVTTPITNQSPVFQNQAFQLDANSANNTLVGIVVASDPDAGQTLTYSILSGNTSGAFIVNSLTGALTVANTSALNFTTNPTFSLILKVLDNGTSSLSKQATIAVNLNNVNISTPKPKVNQRMLKIFYTEENPNVWKGTSTEKGDLLINEQ